MPFKILNLLKILKWSILLRKAPSSTVWAWRCRTCIFFYKELVTYLIQNIMIKEGVFRAVSGFPPGLLNMKKKNIIYSLSKFVCWQKGPLSCLSHYDSKQFSQRMLQVIKPLKVTRRQTLLDRLTNFGQR